MTVEFAQDTDKMACFVNSETPPDKVERLKIFRYSTSLFDSDKIVFCELCKYSYLFEDSVWYHLLTWEEIKVPTWKQANFKLVCDAMKAL